MESMDIFALGVSMIWSDELTWNAFCTSLIRQDMAILACHICHGSAISLFAQVSSRLFQIVRGLGCVPLLELWQAQASLFIGPAYTSACPSFAANWKSHDFAARMCAHMCSLMDSVEYGLV